MKGNAHDRLFDKTVAELTRIFLHDSSLSANTVTILSHSPGTILQITDTERPSHAWPVISYLVPRGSLVKFFVIEPLRIAFSTSIAIKKSFAISSLACTRFDISLHEQDLSVCRWPASPKIISSTTQATHKARSRGSLH